MNVDVMRRAVSASSGRFSPTMPPKADSGIGVARADVGFGWRGAGGDAARIGVLDDDAGRLGELERDASAASRSSRFVYDSSLP